MEFWGGVLIMRCTWATFRRRRTYTHYRVPNDTTQSLDGDRLQQQCSNAFGLLQPGIGVESSAIFFANSMGFQGMSGLADTLFNRVVRRSAKLPVVTIVQRATCRSARPNRVRLRADGYGPVLVALTAIARSAIRSLSMPVGAVSTLALISMPWASKRYIRPMNWVESGFICV